MEYTIQKLADLSGVSTRTLRYYDQIGLLVPTRSQTNGYRIYGQKEVDLLQQILFYRELDMPLEEIGQILQVQHFDREKALENHLEELLQRKQRIESLIQNVHKTIKALKGEMTMSDKEKFEGLKEKSIEDNEKMYGEEIRRKYGKETVDVVNKRVKDMSEEQWEKTQQLSEEINEEIKLAMMEGNPASERAQKVCDLHRQWLCMYWKEGMYSKQAHLGIASMYCEDERFKNYYDAIKPGAAEFLFEAIKEYCK